MGKEIRTNPTPSISIVNRKPDYLAGFTQSGTVPNLAGTDLTDPDLQSLARHESGLFNSERTIGG